VQNKKQISAKKAENLQFEPWLITFYVNLQLHESVYLSDLQLFLAFLR